MRNENKKIKLKVKEVKDLFFFCFPSHYTQSHTLQQTPRSRKILLNTN